MAHSKNASYRKALVLGLAHRRTSIRSTPFGCATEVRSNAHEQGLLASLPTIPALFPTLPATYAQPVRMRDGRAFDYMQIASEARNDNRKKNAPATAGTFSFPQALEALHRDELRLQRLVVDRPWAEFLGN